MVDYFALALSHGLLVMAASRLLWRDDLDQDPPPGKAEPAAEATEVSQSEKPGLRIHA